MENETNERDSTIRSKTISYFKHFATFRKLASLITLVSVAAIVVVVVHANWERHLCGSFFFSIVGPKSYFHAIFTLRICGRIQSVWTKRDKYSRRLSCFFFAIRQASHKCHSHRMTLFNRSSCNNTKWFSDHVRRLSLSPLISTCLLLSPFCLSFLLLSFSFFLTLSQYEVIVFGYSGRDTQFFGASRMKWTWKWNRWKCSMYFRS